MFTYPTSELDEPKKLLSALGSVWANTYQGSNVVESLLYARGQLDTQAHLDFLELLASMSRFNVPVLHTDSWYFLELHESAHNSDNLAQFDGTYNFDGTLDYDVPVGTPFHVWKLPVTLTNVNVLFNRITDASLIWTQGIDFLLRDGAIWFRDNPFDTDLVTKREILKDNESVDRVCGLWLYRSQWDLSTIYQQFGYVLNLKLPSSAEYRKLVNAVYDGMVEGTSIRCIEDAFSVMCDVPLAKTQETVETIFSSPNAQWVVTDQNAYRFHSDATLTVEVGDVLEAGDAMTDTLQFFEFNRGQVPEEIRALAIGKGFLAAGYFQDLVFENKSVPLIIEADVAGYTKISFEIGGWPADVEQFWNEVHARGVAADETLAMLMDTRTNKTGQPTSLALPSTVNPLEFLAENVFRNNVFVVRLHTATFGENALGLQHARILRRLIPPHAACILFVELSASDEITMDGDGSETEAGYTEDADTFVCNTITEEIEPADYIEETVRGFQVSGQCQ